MSRPRSVRWPWALALAASLHGGCAPQAAEVRAAAPLRALAAASRVELVVPAGLDTARLERLARELERAARWKVSFSRTRPSDGGAARIWIADSRSPGIGELAQLNGIVFEAAGAFWFAGERFAAPGDGLVLTVPDPGRAGWPVTVYLAPEAEQAARLVLSLTPSWRRGWSAWRGGLLSREAEGDPRTAATDLSGRHVLAQALSAPTRVESEGGIEWVSHGELPAPLLAGYRARVHRARARALRALGGATVEAPPLRIHVWARLDHMAAATGAWELAAPGVNPGELHALLAGPGLHDGGAEAARATALALLGEPRESWVLDALAVHASERWFGAPLDTWTPVAAARGAGLDEVLDPPRRASPHRFQPLRAVALRHALRGASEPVIRAAWREGTLAARIDRERVERAFARQAARGRELLDGRRPVRKAAREERAWLGVHLVAARDDDGRGGLGYGSQACAVALGDIAALGASAVVLAPIGYECDAPGRPHLRARTTPFAGTTTDAALWIALRQARSAGLRVVLAPQLWSSASSGLTAARQGVDERERAERLAELGAFVEHHALLAELGGVDVLCLADRAQRLTWSWIPRNSGAESPQAPPPLFESVVAAARESYAGALTYLAMMDAEAQSLGLWDELDIVSLAPHRDLTAPANPMARPEDKTVENMLFASLQHSARWARDLDRPLWMMHVGFAPTTEAWRDPRAAWGSYDTREQERLVRAFASAWERARRGDAVPSGAFLWNWSTDPEHGNALDRSFTLQNRPAADVLPSVLRGP